MNTFAVVILAALLLEFTLGTVADLANLRRAPDTVPEPFSDAVSQARYRRSRDYLAANTRHGRMRAAVDLLLFMLMWFGHGFAVLDRLVRGFGWHWIVTGMLYIGALLALRTVVMLPFDAYRTFGIENRFGFNRTSVKTFVSDRIKAGLLGLALGGPLLAAVLYGFGAAGPNAWWGIWLVMTAFMLFVQYLAPTWIMPLFNTYSPLGDGDLRDAIFAMAGKIRFPLDNVLVMDGSRRSTKSNAFFTGFGKNKRIALFDTLIDGHDTPELVAVLAHEMGHYKRHHIRRMMATSILQTGVMLFLLSRFLWDPRLFDAFYMPAPSVYAGLLFFAALFMPLDFFLGLAALALSRRHEFEADRFAVDAMDGDPSPMVGALTKLAADNMANLAPHPLYTVLNASHPPVAARIRAINAYAALGRTGRRT